MRRTPGLRVQMLRLCQSRDGDLSGGKKRVLVPVDHLFWAIFLFHKKKK